MKQSLIIFSSSLILSALFSLYGYTGIFMLPATVFGIKYLYILGLFSPIFHFVVSTWLFLFFPKSGSLIGAVTSFGMFISPFLTFCILLTDQYKHGNFNALGMLVCLLLLILNIYLIFKFLANFKKPGSVPFE